MNSKYLGIIIIILLVSTACSKETTKEVDKTVSVGLNEGLNIENDSFSFDDLFTLLGEEKKVFIEFTNIKNEQENWRTSLFGEKVVINYEEMNGLIEVLNIFFENTEFDPLYNALAEHIGHEGVKDGNIIRWEYYEYEVTLEENRDACIIKIYN